MAKVKPVQRTPQNKPAPEAKAAFDSEKPSTASTFTDEMPMKGKNYKLFLAFVGVLLFGYFLLTIEEFKDARQFSIALHVAPFVIAAGFVGILYAIMAPNKSQTPTSISDN
jgi:hypothetical protein